MNTRLNFIFKASAAILLGLTWTGTTMAQETARTMPDPGTDRASCSEVDWHQDMLREYPWVGDACHEAIVVDGQKWARFEAEFQRTHSDGTFSSDFRNTRGQSMGSVDLRPESGQRVLLDGRPTPFSDLRRGQILNFYAPEGEYTFTTEPGAAASEQVQIAQRDDRRQTDQRRDDQRRDGQSERQLTQAEQRTDTRRETLPATAGPLPILGLGGMLSLLGGMALTMRRRRLAPNA